MVSTRSLDTPDLPIRAFQKIGPLWSKPATLEGGGGGGLKAVVAVVASVAIPFAAPVISSAIGLSTAIGAVAGSALTGAALGAGVAKATGGSATRGALTGAIGGGFGGYAAGASAAPTPTASYGTYSTTNALGPAGGYTYYGGGTPLAAPVAVAPTTVGAGTASLGLDMSGLSSGFAGDPTLASTAGTAGTAGAPPVFTPQTVGTTADIGSQLSTTAPTASPVTASTSGFTYDTFGNVVPAGGSVGGAVAGVQPSVTSLTSTLEPSVFPASTYAAAGTAAAAPATFGEALKQVPGALADKFKDPKTLADMTLRAAGMLAGSALAGEGLSPQEQQLLQFQMDDLDWLRQNNPEAYQMRLEEAQKLLGMSDTFDPEYFGLQRARAAQIRGARAKRAGLRGMTGQSRAVAERQLDIATGRETGTAYDVGAQQAVQSRIQTQQAGLQLLPTPSSYTTPYGDIRQAYSTADARRRQAASDIGGMFGSLTGIPQSQSIG